MVTAHFLTERPSLTASRESFAFQRQFPWKPGSWGRWSCPEPSSVPGWRAPSPSANPVPLTSTTPPVRENACSPDLQRGSLGAVSCEFLPCFRACSTRPLPASPLSAEPAWPRVASSRTSPSSESAPGDRLTTLGRRQEAESSVPLSLERLGGSEFSKPLESTGCQWQNPDSLLVTVCFFLPIKASWPCPPPVQHPRLPFTQFHCFNHRLPTDGFPDLSSCNTLSPLTPCGHCGLSSPSPHTLRVGNGRPPLSRSSCESIPSKGTTLSQLLMLQV